MFNPLGLDLLPLGLAFPHLKLLITGFSLFSAFKGDGVLPRQLECFTLPKERFGDFLTGNHLLDWLALH